MLVLQLLTLNLRLPSVDGDLVSSPDASTEESCASAAMTNQGGTAIGKRPAAELMSLYTLGDAVGLKRVIVNLLDNSIKFTPKLGTITLAVRSLPPIAPGQGGFIEISVKDTGIGMSSSILDKIWEPFYQADLSPQREMGGAGLGLAMVKSIVELHDGNVTVESEVGAGSKFTINLPLVDEGQPIDLTPISMQLANVSGAAQRPTAASPTHQDPTEALIRITMAKPRDVNHNNMTPEMWVGLYAVTADSS